MTSKYENLESEYSIQYDVQSDGTVCLYHMNEEHCAWLTKADLQRMLALIEEKERREQVSSRSACLDRENASEGGEMWVEGANELMFEVKTPSLNIEEAE